ncbi:hypothetical protein [Clostridium perfringens]|uniref:hypothetical protein n=1 Tax=Clostridium perfringens TaxID=1502 RepID=UPI001122392D|nr:hypothetical protein [Clostridium perfringens]TPE22378.1 hypothetical protein FJM09_13580 [Clostridium perfringens]
MELICVFMGLLSFVIAFFVWKNQKLKLFKVQDVAIQNMTEKDKNEASKSIALPIGLLGVLLISVFLNTSKWGSSTIVIIIGIILLFVYVEKRTIDGINTVFKDKKVKVKVYKKRK